MIKIRLEIKNAFDYMKEIAAEVFKWNHIRLYLLIR